MGYIEPSPKTNERKQASHVKARKKNIFYSFLLQNGALYVSFHASPLNELLSA